MSASDSGFINIDAIKAEYSDALKEIKSTEECEDLRIRYLGKKGVFRNFFNTAKEIPEEKKKTVIGELNAFKEHVETTLKIKTQELADLEISRQIENEWIDVSLPGTVREKGSRHPLTIIERKCIDILLLLGFEVVDGPEVETPFHNFDALNIPEHHPARDMQDTFWLGANSLLRSHTSTVQIRVLQERKEFPIKIISPGRVYRNETVDATHLACFHQFEGMWIGEGVNFSHLKGTLEFIIKHIYGSDWDYRFKPKYYPYTEPSVGVDIRHKSGSTKWITVLGAGMVHPNVLRKTGHDPEKLSGFAFGLGISRMVAMAYQVSDMKSLYEGDLRVHRMLAKSSIRYAE